MPYPWQHVPLEQCLHRPHRRAIYSDGGISGGTLTNVTIDNNAYFGNLGGDPTFEVQPAIGFEAGLEHADKHPHHQQHVRPNGKALLAFDANG